MQGANADDCIPSWRILLCLVHSWKVRIAADPHANSPSQTEGRRPCLAPNPHDALCRFCSPSRTHASNPHCCLARGDTSSSVSRSWSICSGLHQSSDWPWQTRMRRRHRPWQEDRHRLRRHNSINSSLRASYSYAGTSTLIYIIIMHALHCSGIAALSDGSSLSPEETLTSQRQNTYVSPLLGAISAGHSITELGLKWALYDFFFFLAFEFPAHGDPLRRDAIPVFCPLH